MAIEQIELQTVSNKRLFGAEVVMTTLGLSLVSIEERNLVANDKMVGVFGECMEGFLSDDEMPQNHREDWTYNLLVCWSAVAAGTIRQLILRGDLTEDQITEVMTDSGSGVSRSLDMHRYARRLGLQAGDRAELFYAGISIANEMIFGKEEK